MTKELKKRLYCLFVGLIAIAWIIPKSTRIIIAICNRTGLNMQSALMFANIAFIVVLVIAIILSIAWIRKYKLLRAFKISVVVAIGIIAVIGLFAVEIITFNSMYVMHRIFDLASGFITLIPKYIAIYLSIVGLFGTYKIKVAEVDNNTLNSGVYAPQNETTFNHTVAVGEDLRKAIYEKYCEEVKKSLKSPASAIFCNIDELSITDNYGVYTVNGWVDSQNSYGAMIRTNVKLNMIMENGQLVSKTNLAISASGKVAKNLIGYYIIGAILTLISFGFFYFIISGML